MSIEIEHANLTALQAAAQHMADRYSEMLANNGMHAEHSLTVRAVVNAINAEREGPNAADIVSDLLRAAQSAPLGPHQAPEAYKRAEAWLAENRA